MPRQSDENFYILALDGGGARGIYPACVLANVERNLGRPIKACFDLITGTSTGAIIAGAAATGVKMSVVVDLFDKEAPQVFHKRQSIRGLVRSKYARPPLERLVKEYLPRQQLGKISKPLLITSSDISTGGVHVFKSKHLDELGEQYLRDRDVLLSDAVLASCAAPTYFDPMQVGEYLLADGGLWANNPSIIAVTEAVSKFKRPIEQVYILSIGTGKPLNLYRRKRFWGLATGWGAQKLVAYFLSLQSQASTNMAKLLLGDRYFRLDPEIEHWGLDDTKHLQNLKAIADRDFARCSKEIMENIRLSDTN